MFLSLRRFRMEKVKSGVKTDVKSEIFTFFTEKPQ
jgi:hypothetical protein